MQKQKKLGHYQKTNSRLCLSLAKTKKQDIIFAFRFKCTSFFPVGNFEVLLFMTSSSFRKTFFLTFLPNRSKLIANSSKIRRND